LLQGAEEEKREKQQISIGQDFIRKRSRRKINMSAAGMTQKEEAEGTKNLSNTNPDTLLVVNPSSSGGLTGKGWEDLFIKIKEDFGETPLEVVFTEKAGDGTTLTREFLEKGFRKVVAIGGDGTINEVVNGFFFIKDEEYPSNKNRNNQNNNTSKIPKASILNPINIKAIMGLIPSGTRNVLAKSLDFPEEVMECCHNFIRGKTQEIDVISATVTDARDHSKTITKVFLNAAEIGFGAEIIDRSKKLRSKINSRIMSTIASIATSLPAYESNLCEVIVDDGRERVLTKMTMGIVANGKFLGGGFMAAPQASVSDGLLDIVILKDSGSFKMLDNLVNMKTGSYANENEIFYMQARKVSLNSKERDVTVTIDGEPIGILPATFQVLEKALKVIM
jgi:YegS/Rv2252/BmrU family lipid kinase